LIQVPLLRCRFGQRAVPLFKTLAAIAKQRPDLILMGIHLPIMNGYMVTRQIKANPALRSIPVIAITSHALDGEEHIARAPGCDDYVPEPYSPRYLLAKIRQLLAPIDRELLQCMSPLLAQSGLATALGDVRFWG